MIKTIIELEVQEIILENSKPKPIPTEISYNQLRKHKSLTINK